MIRLIEALDHRAARIVVGQVLTHISARHRHSTDLGGTARVLTDLVTNAMERTGRDIVVELDWNDDQPVIGVADVGGGAPLDGLTTRRRGGSLGLLIRDDAHTIEVRSHPEGGNTLVITPDLGGDCDPTVVSPAQRRLPAPVVA